MTESTPRGLTTKNQAGWIARGKVNPAMIRCTDGELHAEAMIGPGGWTARLFATERGAARHGNPERV